MARRGGQCVIFRLATKRCAFSIDDIGQILHMAWLSRPPGRPSTLEGFLNLAGTAVPVLRLDRLFRLPEEDPGLYTPLLTLRQSRFPLAVLVHEVEQIVSVSEEELLSVSGEETFNACVCALLELEGQSIPVLDPERILLEEERRRLAEFQALEQERLAGMEAKAP